MAESAAFFEALEEQAAKIMRVFAQAGYEHVAPALIQPADVFLDRIGEAIRNRTYIFADPDGVELCLRPDLTIPSCRLYLERNPAADRDARYAYNGAAFRYSRRKSDPSRPREFRQAGIECFGMADREQAEAEVLGLILEALRVSGLQDFHVRFGDLGLLRALLAALPIPERWRERLLHSFWRPDSFLAVLHQLALPPAPLPDAEVAHLARRLDPDNREAAEQQVAAHLETSGIPLQGRRTIGEITGRLLAAAADMREQPLSRSLVDLVEAYLAISGPPETALEAIATLAAGAKLDLAEPLAAAHRRYALFRAAGIVLDGAAFDAGFGRQFEYYTGFVFQIEQPGRGVAGLIAGGGRYDGLLASIGAPRDAPAIGSAIHTQRLLAAKQEAA